MSLCQVQGNKLVVGARRQMRGLLDSCIISIITIHQFSSSLSCACVIISFLSDLIREIASQIVFVACLSLFKPGEMCACQDFFRNGVETGKNSKSASDFFLK